MNDESVLRARACDAMKAGKLPERPPDRMWGGPGSGAFCPLCGETIGRDEVEFELQFTSDRTSDAAIYHVHTRCFAAWELERRNGASNGRALPQTGDEGKMRNRERNSSIQGEQD